MKSASSHVLLRQTDSIAGRRLAHHYRSSLVPVLALMPLLALAGCAAVTGNGLVSTPVSTATVIQIGGNVHGGQQPVSGSTIQLYTVGTGGLQSASTPMLTSTVMTNAAGNFSLTGQFSCTTVPATQVYITATGGNPGAGTNSVLTLAAALGPCSSLTPSTYIDINEITTVAAAYALAPFARDITDIGASGSNPTGLVNAFQNAAILANTTTGAVGGSSPTYVTLPVAEINTLADIIAACVNSNGSTASGTNCNTLFSATGAAETFGSLLAIAKNPSAPAVTALYTMAAPQGLYTPTLTAQPSDFTVAITSTGNGTLATPYGIAIDAAGNAWVTNESSGVLTQLGVGGAALANYAAGLAGAQGIAIDRTGSLWVANTAGNSVNHFTLSGGSITGSTATANASISAPTSIAVDSNGLAWVSNFNGNSVASVNSSGTAVAYNGSGNILQPTGIAVGPTGSIFVNSASGSVVELTNAGAFTGTLNDTTLQGDAGLAVDSTGRVLATGFVTGSAVSGALSQYSAMGVPAMISPVTTGLSNPAGVATDGTSIWVANNTGSGGLARFNYTSALPLSEASGYGTLNGPVGVAVDSSGSVWTTNSGNNTVSKFIGVAAPSITPLAAIVGP